MKVDEFSLAISDRLEIEDGQNPQEVVLYGKPGREPSNMPNGL